MSSFRITPIGTCRIHTPLARAVGRYDIDADLRRNYGFVHTSEEALQQLRFLLGEKQFPPELVPLLFRADFEELTGQTWKPSDFHIVEISSAKRITCRGEAVQINNVYRHFGDFFASNERARLFWNHVRTGHRRELLDFLEEQRSYQLLSTSDRELLADLSFEQQTFRSLKADMSEITDRLGREKVLFVTHVNATTPDGEVVPARDRLIRWVKLAGEHLSVAVFDPTDMMAEFGQERALEDRGLDLTHYTLAFSDRLYDTIHREHVAPVLGSRSEPVADERSREIAASAARIESTIELGDFFEGARELFRALDRFPEATRLVQLRGVIRSRVGDFRGAVEDLSGVADARHLPQHVRVAMMEAFIATGGNEAALQVGQGLINDETETVEVYRLAGEAAERSGNRELAVGYAKQAYRLDRRDLSSALRAIILMSDSSDIEQLAEWRAEILENVGASSSGGFEVCLWAVRHGDEELFAVALERFAAADKAGSIDLMEQAFAAGLWRAVAASIGIAVNLGRLSRSLAERRAALLGDALGKAKDLAQSGDIAAAFELARAVELLRGIQSDQLPIPQLVGEARLLIRELAAGTREAVRAAFEAGDAAAVIEAGRRGGEIPRYDARTATLIARSLQATGDTAGGLELLKNVSEPHQDSLVVRRWMARLATAVQDYATALEMYGSLREANDPSLAKVRPEIERFFNTAQPRSLKQLTLLSRAGKVEEAIRLAHAINTYLGPHERTERELGRIHKLMRLRLKQIEQGEGAIEEREAVLRQIVLVRPDDIAFVRRLALELMRQFRFAEAAEYWERICVLDPRNESASRNRVRCATLAKRRMSASTQVSDVVG